MDLTGDLYGTAGYAVELSPGFREWTEKVIHKFRSGCKGGFDPYAGMILGASGNLYGTTIHSAVLGVLSVKAVPQHGLLIRCG
jgi:hypothetical protein